MIRLVISDIFGRTSALESLCFDLGMPCEIMDPYSGEYMGFRDEREAYAVFSCSVGLDAYAGMIQSRLAAFVHPVLVLAFSVGASALWKISDKLASETVTCATCYYGSQIRHSLEIIPDFPFNLVLPAKEPGFSVEKLANALERIPNTRIFRSDYLHGFMNKESKNYSEQGYREYMDQMKLMSR